MENTTEVTTVADVTTPAVPANEPGAAAIPAGEQQGILQKLATLLTGKQADAPAAGSQEAPPAETTPAPTSADKTYTDADLQERIEAERQRWAADQAEQARLAKLSPEARAQAEAEAKDKELSALKAQLLQRDLKESAVAALDKGGIPVALAEFLDYSGKEGMEKSLDKLQGVFKASLAAAVNERLRGKTPEGLGGAANAENAIRDQIAKNIRGGI